jgi:hypothetical protein
MKNINKLDDKLFTANAELHNMFASFLKAPDSVSSAQYVLSTPASTLWNVWSQMYPEMQQQNMQ